MQLDLSAPKVITFSVAVVIALIAAIVHYAHLSVPYVTHRVHAPVCRFFDPGRRQRVSRVVVKAQQIVKGRGLKPSLLAAGFENPDRVRSRAKEAKGHEMLCNTPFVRIPFQSRSWD